MLENVLWDCRYASNERPANVPDSRDVMELELSCFGSAIERLFMCDGSCFSVDNTLRSENTSDGTDVSEFEYMELD